MKETKITYSTWSLSGPQIYQHVHINCFTTKTSLISNIPGSVGNLPALSFLSSQFINSANNIKCDSEFRIRNKEYDLMIRTKHAPDSVACHGRCGLWTPWHESGRRFPPPAVSVVVENISEPEKLLRTPRIDSKESIPPAYVAWRAGTTILLLFGS